jgi:hypothetical protein
MSLAPDSVDKYHTFSFKYREHGVLDFKHLVALVFHFPLIARRTDARFEV